ncbi:hypothetical protein FK513_32095, partial [Klebsiella pneumoniae]|uniref:FKBP-type peptidyl-prolyl cis-trans isomerase N-terminal domain-containing protein n=1 Tax=Klebsiella pneumoniae TaxID=573 RepID=UPI00272E532E
PPPARPFPGAPPRDQEIEQTLQAFETRVKTAAQQKMEKDATENEAKGKAFRDNFAKEKGVKTSKTGLLYKVEKEGAGERVAARAVFQVGDRRL